MILLRSPRLSILLWMLPGAQPVVDQRAFLPLLTSNQGYHTAVVPSEVAVLEVVVIAAAVYSNEEAQEEEEEEEADSSARVASLRRRRK